MAETCAHLFADRRFDAAGGSRESGAQRDAKHPSVLCAGENKKNPHSITAIFEGELDVRRRASARMRFKRQTRALEGGYLDRKVLEAKCGGIQRLGLDPDRRHEIALQPE